jgi:hypothetical protein
MKINIETSSFKYTEICDMLLMKSEILIYILRILEIIELFPISNKFCSTLFIYNDNYKGFKNQRLTYYHL